MPLRSRTLFFHSVHIFVVYRSIAALYKLTITPHGEYRTITKTRLFKYIETFTFKNWKFSNKNPDIFLISAQNIDCGYSLEPPRRGGPNEYHNLCFWTEIRKIIYTPVKPNPVLLY